MIGSGRAWARVSGWPGVPPWLLLCGIGPMGPGPAAPAVSDV